MNFTPEQNTQLSAPLNAKCIKSRSQAGRSLSYIEGWHAISEANRIFGFGGWKRETADLRMVAENQRKVGQGEGWGVTYIAKVRVTVGDVVREGCGTGHGIDRDLGQAHESALKEAETDGMKRALMTFGNQFGLALYDKEQSGVEHDAPAPDAPRTIAADINEATLKARKWADDAIAAIKQMDPKALSQWEMDNGKTIVRLKAVDIDKHKELLAAMQACDGLAQAAE